MSDGSVTASVNDQLTTWPGQALSGFDSPVWSVIGIVFGLGFVLSFGYWTTNFVEVQRAMASNSMSSARRSPIIATFPKMFIRSDRDGGRDDTGNLHSADRGRLLQPDGLPAGKAWFYRPVPLAAVSLTLTIILNIIFH